MKKFITIGVGTLMIAGAIIPFASASRDAYHAIVHNYRSFGEYQPSRDGYYVAQKPQVRERFQVNNNGEPYIYDKDAYEALSYPYRPTTYTRGRIANQYRYYRPGTAERGALRANYVPEDIAVDTYEDAGFSFQMPQGAMRNANDNYVIYDLGELRVAIRKYSPNICSDQLGFFACGVKISKNENRLATYGNADAITTSRIIRQTNFSDTILDSQMQTRTYTEAFSAHMNHGIEKYISRLMVADVDGSVYMIEVQSPVEAMSDNVTIANEVFDSFRIYPY